MQHHTPQEFEKADALFLRCLAGMPRQIPEFCGRLRQCVAFTDDGCAIVLAYQDEFAQIGHEDEPVLRPVAGDLFSRNQFAEVSGGTLHFDDAAFGRLAELGLDIRAALELRLGEQSAVWQSGTSIRQAHHASDARLEVPSDLVQQV